MRDGIRHLKFDIRHWQIVAITLVAAVLRFWRLDQLPPGLFHDEAFNGLDVLRVLAGWHPIYFPGNFGREPLFIYLVVASVAALGRTPGAIRLVSAILGTLTVPAAYLAARELFSRRIGLLTAALTAVTLWHVALSRVGFRAISLPLIASLAVWQGALAWRTRRARHWIVAGALTGLTLYTYLSARFIPVALAVFAAYYFVRNRARITQRVDLKLVGLGLLALLIVALPLGWYALNHAHEMIVRAGQVSVFSPEVSQGQPVQLLARQTVDTLTMFFWRGDMTPRHNVPGRAVFDPVVAIFFLIGTFICTRRAASQYRMMFILLWTLVMLLPSILAESAPSFLRAIGALPIAFILPALGLDAAWNWLSARGSKVIGAATVGLGLLIALILTTLTYFGSYSTSRELHEAFDASPVEMAVDLNRWLGTGWQGGGLSEQRTPVAPGRYAWIDPALWNFSIAAPFLVTESPTQSISLHLMPVRSIPPDVTAIKLVALPTDEDAFSSLPHGWRIQARRGAVVGGVPGQAPYLLYTTFEAEPARDVKTLARFGAEIELVSERVSRAGTGVLTLRTEWRANQDVGEELTLFVQVVRDGQAVAQHDGPPADGLLPTSRWRAGDVIVDERELSGSFVEGRDEIRIGLYRPGDNTRLPIEDASGHSTGLDYWLAQP